MNVCESYILEHAVEHIKLLEEPMSLTACLMAIIAQRCKIGGAKEGTCKGCKFQSHYCREIYNISEDELKRFRGDW